MQGTENSGLIEATPVSPALDDAQPLVNAFIFDADVHEVFLLVDYISGRTEKSLKDLDTTGIELPAAQGELAHHQAVAAYCRFPAVEKPSVSDVLNRLCQIGYPRHPDPMTRAAKAAFVLGIKDRLNALANPARGVTIAYTAMFLSIANRYRFFGRSLDKQNSRVDRFDLARRSYPNLEPHAQSFARLFRQFPLVVLLGLVLTASAYWDVGFGRSIVQRIEHLNKEISGLTHPTGQPGQTVLAVSDRICEKADTLPAEKAQTCDTLSSLEARLQESRATLYSFAVTAANGMPNNAILSMFNLLRPIHYGFIFSGQAPPQDRPEVSVARELSLFSTYVLPVMFGLLGTFAAITRAIHIKLRDSLLSPRDFSLTAVGLFNGPIAGLAVGLFYSPTDAATSDLTGTVSLSAPALGFVAGYGADAFFRFVDALLERLFTAEQSKK